MGYAKSVSFGRHGPGPLLHAGAGQSELSANHLAWFALFLFVALLALSTAFIHMVWWAVENLKTRRALGRYLTAWTITPRLQRRGSDTPTEQLLKECAAGVLYALVVEVTETAKDAAKKPSRLLVKTQRIPDQRRNRTGPDRRF